MTNKRTATTRPPLTDEELWHLTPDQFLRLKLSDDEKFRLREINKERERERQASVLRVQEEEALLVSELQAAGFEIASVGDLIVMAERYEAAIPILLKHLLMPYSDVLRSSIARSLAVPESEVLKAWPTLVKEYCKASMGWGFKAPGDTRKYKLGTKNALACVLSVAVTDETLPELIKLAKDQRHGESRVLLLSALKKRRNKNPLAKQAIDELASDPELQKEIASWGKR